MRISDWSSDVCSSDLPFLRINRSGSILEPPGKTPSANSTGGVRTAPPSGSIKHVRERRRCTIIRARKKAAGARPIQIGRAHVLTPVTNAQLVCRLLLEKKKKRTQ